ncbi:MAG: glycosyltransferase family 25 protein [Phycisphaerales bacterium]|nr:glycosyltransferase family 25 protein [Phycisphaerales bacterium]
MANQLHNFFAEVFDQIYVLNLADRVDRRREMVRELERVRFPEAGEGGGRLMFFPAIRVEEAAGFPSAGVRGCYLSHLAIFKDALRRQFSRVLILEDDLSFSPLVGRCDAMLAELVRQRSWDFVWFGHVLPARAGGAGGEVKLERFFEPIVTAHFYALDRAVLGPLVEYFEAVLTRQPGDPEGGPMYNDAACNMFRAKFPRYVTLVARPSLGWQRASRSDIVPKWFDRQPVLREVAALIRRAKR